MATAVISHSACRNGFMNAVTSWDSSNTPSTALPSLEMGT
jgi:hypothetical protein